MPGIDEVPEQLGTCCFFHRSVVQLRLALGHGSNRWHAGHALRCHLCRHCTGADGQRVRLPERRRTGWRLAIRDDLFIVVAMAAELLLLAVFLGVTPLA